MIVNYHKSKLFVSPNIPRREAQSLSARCNVPLTADLGKYLGVPIVHGRTTKQLYAPILDNLRAKLGVWKRHVVSRAGRRTLAQSVLNAIPVYIMQTVLLPASICQDIDRLVRNFIWGGSEDASHGHLIN